MSFTFETNGNNTFLVYNVQAQDVLDTMTLGMITNNKIPGFSSVLYTQMNMDRYIKYNVTSKITLSQFFTGNVTRKRLLGVFSSIAAALSLADEYMIDRFSILLDPNYIYTDVSTCKAELVCLPIVGAVAANDISLFFKNIMFSTQFDSSENCDYVARIISYLNSSSTFSVEEFSCLLEELKQTASGSSDSYTAPTPQPVAQQPVQNPVPPVKKEEIPIPPQMPKEPPVGNRMTPPNPIPEPVKVSQSLGQGKAGGVTSAPTPAGQEKEMSIFYLLQHYNKENAAAYKAQKEAKKSGTKQSKPLSSGAAGVGFAIPGQKEEFAKPQVQQPQVQQPQVQQPQVQQPQVQQPQVQQPQVQQPQVRQTSQPFEVPNNQGMYAVSFQGEDFGSTVLMGQEDMGEHTVLMTDMQASAAVKPFLYRISNNEKIYLDKPVFHIGKERSYVDYCITGNPTVSRNHADILNKNGQIYIMDTNSTNHTYINGEMIPSNTEVLLTHGTRIRLSNEEFEFKTF